MFQMKKTPETRAPAAPERDERRAAASDRPRAPRCDILEHEDRIVVVADMPGVDRESVDITLDKGVLVLRGTVRGEVPDGFQPVLMEYQPATWERSFTLPDAIDPERVEATVANGVLTLTLPKAKEARPRRIEVKAG